MATQINIDIRRNRHVIITVDVTGVSSWTGLLSKFYIANSVGGSILLDINATPDGPNNKITAVIKPENTSGLSGVYYHELILYKADLSYLKTVIFGKCKIANVIKIMP